MAYLSVKDLTRIYQSGDVSVKAIENISFDIQKGEMVAIIGPSGAGKTTVLNILGGMDKADDGTIFVAGKDISKLNEKELTNYRKDDVGFVFQFYNLVQNLTAYENIELSTQICNDVISAYEILKDVGLEERINNFPSQLSGGEQQRVSIARALAKKPKILLCDEPTGALDYNTGKEVLKLLQDTCKKNKMTVIIVTHNQAITPMVDRVIKIKNGQVEENFVNEAPVSVEEIEW